MLIGLAVLTAAPQAKACVTVLPMMIAPWLRLIDTHAASMRGLQPANIGEPYSVGMSPVSITSLTPIGRP